MHVQFWRWHKSPWKALIMSVSQQTETPPCHEDPWPPGPLARRERRAIPGAVCEERATKPAGPRAAAQRGASRAKLGILDDVRHRLRRGASHLPARRSRQSVHIISSQTLKPELHASAGRKKTRKSVRRRRHPIGARHGGRISIRTRNLYSYARVYFCGWLDRRSIEVIKSWKQWMRGGRDEG